MSPNLNKINLIPRPPNPWTTVTPLSKTVALVLFISLPFLGFYLGRQYQKAVAVPAEPIIIYRQNNQPTISPAASPTVTPAASAPETKIYSSSKLGVSFNYSAQTYSYNDTFLVKEVGDKIYVYSSKVPYTQGQWLQVFAKDRSGTLSTTIQKEFLTNYPTQDCFVTTPAQISTTYPTSYQTASIDVPRSGSDDPSTLLPKWQKCPEPYVSENGISYFLEDADHPEKFIYLSIGQYPIDSGLPGKMWQETIKFL